MDVKKILVPTDFSNYANYAGEVAYEIAKKISANLRFYHQLHFLVNFSELDKEVQKNCKQEFVDEKEVEQKFEELKLQYETGVPLETITGYGNLITEITESVEKDKIDLVVMGTRGRNEKFYSLGTNTMKVLRLAACPVLVVKSKQENFKINNIVFASDFSNNALPVFEKLMKFVKPFNAKVHLFNIDVNRRYQDIQNLFQASVMKFKEIADENLGVVYSYPDKSIEEGINHISNEYGVDLIAIGTHFREFDDIMYNSFITETIVNKVDIPVLALHFDDEEDDYSIFEDR